MNRLTAVAATVIFVGPQALATDSIDQSMVSKRQMIAQIADCVKKRISAEKDSTYKEAIKVCKNQIDKENANLPSEALVADTQAKP
jgi:hypothetical protein